MFNFHFPFSIFRFPFSVYHFPFTIFRSPVSFNWELGIGNLGIGNWSSVICNKTPAISSANEYHREIIKPVTLELPNPGTDLPNFADRP